MKTVFVSDYCNLSYEENLKILTITWTEKRPSLEEYQRPFAFCNEFVKTTPVDNFISDVRVQPTISPEFRKWLQEAALPIAAKSGLKRIAVVGNINIFKQYYINHIYQSVNKLGVPLKTFNTIEEAKKWFAESA